MPFQLDDYDISILKSLMKDGRKSFREISRETGITTPTVKARFQRLVNVGFIKSVSPIFDFGVVEETILDNGDQSKNKEHNNSQYLRQQLGDFKSRIKKGIKIKLDCEFCKGPIAGHLHVFKFANYERFFCCTACMSSYKQKYAGRIESIIRKFEEKD
ncbi:MAG: winged helix-turn-helix transcriptional regulator [Nitrososphaeraceae archaeon]